MERTPNRAEQQVATAPAPKLVAADPNWRDGLPVLQSGRVTLRQLRPQDAQTLWAFLSSAEVARFISPPPATVDGFERFIAWTERQRQAGMLACLGVHVEGFDTPIGLFQLRQLDPGFATAEWGFAIGSAFWGTGVFRKGAELMLQFAFDVVGVHRLEARSCLVNGRGNSALRKIGAVQEGVLRRSFLRNGEYLDQVLWSVLEEDWRQAKVIWGGEIKLH